MSKAVKPSDSNSAPTNLSDFILAQKSGYLQAVGKGETEKNSWTISMGNEAGGQLGILLFPTLVFLIN
jgi:hypothetical protein